MKQAIPRIIICLLLGIFSTFAFAWGRAFFWPGATGYNPLLSESEPTLYHHDKDSEYDWHFSVERRFGMMEVFSFSTYHRPDLVDSYHDYKVERDDLVKWGYIYEYALNDQVYETLPFQDLGYGWPVPALAERHEYFKSMRFSVVTPQLTPATHYFTIDVPPILHKLGSGRTLPVRILPFGFIINVLTYAVLWFALFWGIAAARSIVRRVKGRCLKCAYDLRHADHKACPECGAPNH